jgi:hypothetical protein
MAVTSQEITEIAQEAIDSKSPAFVELESFSTKLSDEGKEEGDVLKVGVYSKNSSSDFNVSTNNYETEDGGGVSYVNVTLDKHIKSTFTISAQTTYFDMARMMKGAVVAVAEGANKYVYDLITAANYTTVGFTGAASTFDHVDVADLWNTAQDGEYAADERSMILTNPYYASLLKDANLAEWDKAATDETLRDAVVRKLYDFDTMSSNVLATSAGAVGVENLVGFITDKSAMAVATGLPAIQDPESTALVQMVETMQAPNGLTMQFRKHTDPASGAVFGTVELLIGRQVCDATRLARLVSA